MTRFMEVADNNPGKPAPVTTSSTRVSNTPPSPRMRGEHARSPVNCCRRKTGELGGFRAATSERAAPVPSTLSKPRHFSCHSPEVESAITTLPVWIETRADTPPGGIKAYADSAVAETTTRGFYVVLTTHPREWRISMNPPDIASPEGVRLAGDAMGTRFTQQSFLGGRYGANAPSQDHIHLNQPAIDRTYRASIEADWVLSI